MQLGFVSAILQEYTFEQMLDFASQNGFRCVEAACWPKGRAQRRYAGVTHIDVEAIDKVKAGEIKKSCAEKGVALSALAYYPNVMEEDPEKRAFYVCHLKKVIAAANLLDVNVVTTFIGRMQTKNTRENLLEFEKVWGPIIAYAESLGVRIAIENCPMLFTADEWPGGQNLFTSPALFRRMFEIIPSPNFGINFDPSHFVWQMMDYIKPLYEFSGRIFHVHCKDIKLLRDRLDDVGILAAPLEFMRPKLPGLGDVDWGAYISALTDIGYDGAVCIEVEDKAFEGSAARVEDSLRLSKRYLSQFIV